MSNGGTTQRIMRWREIVASVLGYEHLGEDEGESPNSAEGKILGFLRLAHTQCGGIVEFGWDRWPDMFHFRTALPLTPSLAYRLAFLIGNCGAVGSTDEERWQRMRGSEDNEITGDETIFYVFLDRD